MLLTILSSLTLWATIVAAQDTYCKNNPNDFYCTSPFYDACTYSPYATEQAYASVVDSGGHTLYIYCAPSGKAGDVGAKAPVNSMGTLYYGCGGDSFAGHDNAGKTICGGLGAMCDDDTDCYNPDGKGFRCNVQIAPELGHIYYECGLASPQSTGLVVARNRRRALEARMMCSIPGEIKCTAESDCFDPMTSLENCGGCTSSGQGVDCSEMDDNTECYQGQCLFLGPKVEYDPSSFINQGVKNKRERVLLKRGGSNTIGV